MDRGSPCLGHMAQDCSGTSGTPLETTHDVSAYRLVTFCSHALVVF